MLPKGRHRTRMALWSVGLVALLAAEPDQPPPSCPPGAPPAAVSTGPEQAAAGSALPISLPLALRLAQTANLDIAQAREVVNQVQAGLERARVQILPSVGIGSTYVHHEGQIQKTEGNIITANRDSLFVGGGPSLTLSLADGIFGPIAARQVFAASQAGLQRVNNDTLLAVAEVYLNVLRARRRLARIDETLEFLTSERPSRTRGGSKGLLPLVRDVVELGGRDAFRSDLERMRVEVLRRQEERAAALQDFANASAELARLVRLDPERQLWPAEDFRFPLELPGEAWSGQPVHELVGVALNNRPELAENQALVRAAVSRVQAARARPLLPNVVLNYAWGDFGGSPDPNPPIVHPPTRAGQAPTVTTQPGFGPSGRIEHFAPRTDFDVSLVWRVQNLGFGNRAEIREQESLQRQALLRQARVQDQVVTQVVQAYDQVEGGRERLAVTRAALFDAAGAPDGPVFRSLRLNFERIRGAEGRPLEALDSIRGLSDVLEAYGQAATDYDRARFRLLVALGVSPQTLFEAKPAPCAPAP